MSVLVPKRCLDYLPFVAEPITQWRENGDIQNFLYDLFDAPSVGYAPNGERFEGSYRDYGKVVFDQERAAAIATAHALTAVSAHDYHQDHAKIRALTHDFGSDPLFGRAAKGIVACKGVLSAILSESGYMSLYHILETDSDLDCSLHLLKHHFYRQSGYCLRSFLENSVLPVYFTAHQEDYKRWKTGAFHTPPLRGQKGLLAAMSREGLIDESLRQAISSVYEQLNAYVHSSAPAMIHTGHDTGEWRGLSFKLDAVHRWCELVVQACDARVRLAERENDCWHQVATKGPTMCDVCHGTDFIRTEESAGHHKLWRCRCKTCGNVWLQSVESGPTPT